MNTISFDVNQTRPFKILNAINNGPLHNPRTDDQYFDNLALYKAARIPYARNHDASFYSGYGGNHSVDVAFIFPDFDADPCDPASYDFACTDEYIMVTEMAGTKTFYRLGHHIEHEVKKYGTLPPKDFHKWAVICEHIIMHYNEGWANGFHYDLEYWEIWNEPNGDADDSSNKRCWGGTAKQFYDFYETAAKYLKNRFPHLKIGGPSLCAVFEWIEPFFSEMQKRGVPFDFISFHTYVETPEVMLYRANRLHEVLEKCGYGDVPLINNEWNYICNWNTQFVYSIRQIISMKGAAFTAACMCAAQESVIDMLMYYDARPCKFNGLFDFYTLDPLKGYYPFLWFGGFYDGYESAKRTDESENLYALCGVNREGKRRVMAVHYNKDDDIPAKQVRFDLGAPGRFRVTVLDRDRTNEPIGETEDLTFDLPNLTALLLEEI